MSAEAAKGLFVFVAGMVVGSFLDVCIYRIPKGISLLSPGSLCPKCERAIRFYDNIPVVSFLLLWGRCRRCGERIGWTYPAVELLTGLVFLALSVGMGWAMAMVRLCVLSAVLIPAAVIDLRHGIIPDRITYPAMGIGVLLALPGGWGAVIRSVIGLAVGGGVLYGVALLGSALLRRDSLGGGDIKLLAAIGAFLGWQGALWSLFLGALIALAVGVALMLFARRDHRGTILFGPFLALGAAACVALARLGFVMGLSSVPTPW